MAFPNANMKVQPNSPRVQANESYSVITRTYQIPHGLTEAQRVAGDYYPDIDDADAEFTNALYDGSHRLSPSVGYDYLEIDWTERFPSISGIYQIHNASYEAPIETDDNFKMCWKYRLWAKEGTVAMPPAWSLTAVDANDTLASAVPDGTMYRWSVNQPSGFPVFIQDATKAGVNTHIQQTSLITKTKVYDNITDAAEWAGEVGYLCAPCTTFSLLSDAQYWLIRDVRITEDHGMYAVMVEFLFSDFGWDSDIYTAADISDDC